MKKKIILTILAAIVALVAYWIFSGSGFQFVQHATGVKLPAGCLLKKHWDTGNGFLGGVLKLPPKEVEHFLEINHFRLVSEMPTLEDIVNDTSGKLQNPMQLMIPDVFKNRPGYPPIPEEPGLMYLRGTRGDKWPWEFVVNPLTGDLWVIVIYPDAGGD